MEYVGSSGVVVGVGVGVEVGVVEAAAGWGKQTAGAAAAATAAGAGLCLPLQVYEPAQWALSAVHLDELSDIQMPPSQCLHQKLPNITSRKHSKNAASRLLDGRKNYQQQRPVKHHSRCELQMAGGQM